MLSRYPIEGDTVVVFQGPTGQQRYVRIEYADDTKQFYEGSTGAERVVKIEYPDGETVFYEGRGGAPRASTVCSTVHVLCVENCT